MSQLTAKQRAALPASAFAGPGRTYPILDDDDVRSAALLLGKAKNPEAVKRRVIMIARAKGLTLPKAWEADAKAGEAKLKQALKSAVDGR